MPMMSASSSTAFSATLAEEPNWIPVKIQYGAVLIHTRLLAST